MGTRFPKFCCLLGTSDAISGSKHPRFTWDTQAHVCILKKLAKRPRQKRHGLPVAEFQQSSLRKVAGPAVTLNVT